MQRDERPLDECAADALSPERRSHDQMLKEAAPAIVTAEYGANDLFAFWQAEGVAVVEGRTDDVLAAADVVITASGTATVQAALHERPMVVVYQVSRMSYRLGKGLLKVNTFAMPNLIAGHRIVPELIQEDFTPERVAEEAVLLLTDPVRSSVMKEALRGIRQQLGVSGASGRAAEAILGVMHGNAPPA